MKARNSAVFICLATLSASLAHAQQLRGPAIQIELNTAHTPEEVFSIKVDGAWQPVLATAAVVHLVTSAGVEACPIAQADLIDGALVFTGNCSVGVFQQRVALMAESDVVDVSTLLKLNDGASARYNKKRYEFLPPRHTSIDKHTGPLDFV